MQAWSASATDPGWPGDIVRRNQSSTHAFTEGQAHMRVKVGEEMHEVKSEQ
jgi:hypothetical protein